MTTELEQQFFKVFGINKRCCHDNYKHQKEVCHRIPEQCQDYQYPEITAEKLLLIEDILLKHYIQLEYCFYDNSYYCSCTIPLCNGKADNKKDAFLEMLICIANNYLDNSDIDGEEVIYHQVHSLFEKANNDKTNPTTI